MYFYVYLRLNYKNIKVLKILKNSAFSRLFLLAGAEGLELYKNAVFSMGLNIFDYNLISYVKKQARGTKYCLSVKVRFKKTTGFMYPVITHFCV